MPYIAPGSRIIIDLLLESLKPVIKSLKVGDLNYTLTKIIHQWIIENEKCCGRSYKNLNAAIGILECVKIELYRCVVAPYEDKKKNENGCISKLDDIKSKKKWRCKVCDIGFEKFYSVIGTTDGATYCRCPNCGADESHCVPV